MKIRKKPVGAATALITCAILWLTLAPHPVGDTDIPLFAGADKVVHAIMFGALAVAMVIDYRLWRGRYPSVGVTLMFALISTLAGGLIEILQSSMGLGREGDGADLAADAAGALICSLLTLIGPLRRRL